MSTTTSQDPAAITLSERAATEIKSLLEQQGMPEAFLRVFVSGGGCSGLQYGMTIAEESEEGDLQLDQFGVKVLVDDVSVNYIAGSTVDFVEDEMGGGFKIDNPNAAAGCGCGSSCCSDESDGGCGSCGGGCH